MIPRRNARINTAQENYLLDLERQEIDRLFEMMAEEDDYLAMNEQMSELFSESDWDAFIEGENQ